MDALFMHDHKRDTAGFKRDPCTEQPGPVYWP